MYVTGRLERLEPYQQVALPLARAGRLYPVAEPYLADDAPAALGHPVDLALLDVETLGKRRLGQYPAGQEHALPPNPGNEYIKCPHAVASCMTPGLQSCMQTPQPLQRSGSISTNFASAPSTKESAMQPALRQSLHALHRSLSTASGFPPVLWRSTQGWFETRTESPSACISSLNIFSSPLMS